MEYNEQILKVKLKDNKIKMEIDINDLKFLLENSPDNYHGEKIIKGKEQEFAKWFIERMLDFSDPETGNPYWGKMINEIFVEIFEGYHGEFCDWR